MEVPREFLSGFMHRPQLRAGFFFVLFVFWRDGKYEGFIGLSLMTAFRYYRVRGDSVRWRRSDGPVRPALGCGLVLAVARDDHGPTAARLAL
jgi:hypothetical protein